MSLKETVIKLTCVVTMLVCFCQTASADWYDDIKPNSTWLPIEGDNFVADTFMGVPALYNESNGKYQCGELIIRFYKEAYGIDVYPYTGGTPDSDTSGYEFVKTKSPKKGDIIYVSKEMRGSATDHWAIVKDYSDGYITMFEQNAIYNGGAAYERKIKFPSDSYYIYTPVSTGDAPDPVLKNAGMTSKPSQSVSPVEPTTQEKTEPVATTKPVATEPSTAKPTQQATTQPVTTRPATTKPAATTSPAVKATTTVQQTKPTAVATTLAVTGEDVSSTLTETSLTATELNTTHKASEKTENTAKESVTDLAKAEVDNGEKAKKIAIAVGVCAALVTVAAVTMTVANRKRK